MALSLTEKLSIFEGRLNSVEAQLGNAAYSMLSVARTEMQDRLRVVPQSELQFGMYTAICVETVDVWKQNRVRFFCPLYHDPSIPIKSLPWAFPVSPFGGFDDCGVTWVPPAGSTLCLIFEGGARNAPFYLGTTWGRNRGPVGQQTWGVNVDEYFKTYQGHRGGYLCGPNDESQVLPPWNTENFNGFDINSIADFDNNPEAQKRITIPNIFGFKTPEKHMFKMVDGDPKCNRKWKRIEIMSGCGNWMIFKDDHLHFGGQWAHPSCGGGEGDTSCVSGVSNPDASEDITRNEGVGLDDIPDQPADPDADAIDLSLFEVADSIADASSDGDDPVTTTKKETTSCGGEVIGGHPRTPKDRCGKKKTAYMDSQKGANPFFKNQNECRPYRGLGIGGNKCDLPQSGIQIMSISGHTFVMDDSVEEPSGDPTWERSLQKFDAGCNNKYLGWMYLRSATGHQITLDDAEEETPNVRGKTNGIRLQSATGNRVELNDHTVSGGKAGEERGVTIESSSTHKIQLCDEGNLQEAARDACGNPTPQADKAYILIRTGYGMEIRMADQDSQEETRQQYTQIFCPQKDNADRGPHIMRFQERPSGPGQIFLRAGGDYIVSTYDNLIEIVGDKEKNPSDRMEIVSRNNVVSTEKDYLNVADLHLFLAKRNILLLAGEDCPGPSGPGPCVGPVLVYANGCIKLSDRVFASASPGAGSASIFMLEPFCSMAAGGN